MPKTLTKTTVFEFPEVRVVEASAGAGKTYALAKRYVQLLLSSRLPPESIPMRRILAITFTNKAAFQMKERILFFLKSLALDTLPETEKKEIAGPLGLSDEQVRQKAYAIVEVLIRHYNFFQVQTIDKFINALLSGCAFKIGLTANFRIKTNSADYIHYSLDQLIEQALTDEELRGRFYYFLNNYLYLENRSGWFPKEDMLGILKTLFTQHNTYGQMFCPGEASYQDLVKLKAQTLADMRELREKMPDGIHAGFLKSFDKFLKNCENGYDIDSVSNYFARPEIPVRKGAKVSDEVIRLWSRIYQNLRKVCETEAFCLFNPYAQIFEKMCGVLRTAAVKDDILFLEELNMRASRLFDEDYITVEELYYRLATRFSHYLIDEFQDTSRLQWLNLFKMVEEALSTGGTLFYVGDRKQAIYSFRGGDVRLFEEIKSRFQMFNVKEEVLSRNWRSHKAIVDFNNTVFSIGNLQRFIRDKEIAERKKPDNASPAFTAEDYAVLERIYENAGQTGQPRYDGGYVSMEFIDEDRKEARDEVVRRKLLALIKDLRRRYACRDITLLTRGNREVEQLTNWLLEAGIFVESERTSNIRENVLIEELAALLRFLESPIDNVSFTRFILGDIFSRATNIPVETMHSFVFSLRDRLKKESGVYIYREFQKKYPGIWQDYFEEFFKNVGLYPLYELTVSIYSRFQCLENFPDDQGYLMHFINLIKKYEEDYPDIDAFLDYLENMVGDDLYVRIADTDAVKILTVHKAKGLEFPVVILPFLGMEVQVGSRGDDNQQSYILQFQDLGINLLRLKKKYYKFSDSLYDIYAEEYKRNFMAELNNVYVALTRAKNELYGFIPKYCGKSLNLAPLFIPEDLRQAGTPAAVPDEEEETARPRPVAPARYRDWLGYLREEFIATDTLRNRVMRRKGSLIHFLLSCCEKVGDKNRKAVLEAAASRARPLFPHSGDFAECLAAIEKVLKDERCREFFDLADGEDVFTEKDIVNLQGHTRRIDRLIVRESTVDIVDFKSGFEREEEQQAQVREYMDLTKTVYPQKKVRGFLLYLDEVKVVEVG